MNDCDENVSTNIECDDSKVAQPGWRDAVEQPFRDDEDAVPKVLRNRSKCEHFILFFDNLLEKGKRR
jgi:hypothetical protein